jgi:mbt repeat
VRDSRRQRGIVLPPLPSQPSEFVRVVLEKSNRPCSVWLGNVHAISPTTSGGPLRDISVRSRSSLSDNAANSSSKSDRSGARRAHGSSKRYTQSHADWLLLLSRYLHSFRARLDHSSLQDAQRAAKAAGVVAAYAARPELRDVLVEGEGIFKLLVSLSTTLEPTLDLQSLSRLIVACDTELKVRATSLALPKSRRAYLTKLVARYFKVGYRLEAFDLDEFPSACVAHVRRTHGPYIEVAFDHYHTSVCWLPADHPNIGPVNSCDAMGFCVDTNREHFNWEEYLSENNYSAVSLAAFPRGKVIGLWTSAETFTPSEFELRTQFSGAARSNRFPGEFFGALAWPALGKDNSATALAAPLTTCTASALRHLLSEELPRKPAHQPSSSTVSEPPAAAAAAAAIAAAAATAASSARSPRARTSPRQQQRQQPPCDPQGHSARHQHSQHAAQPQPPSHAPSPASVCLVTARTARTSVSHELDPLRLFATVPLFSDVELLEATRHLYLQLTVLQVRETLRILLYSTPLRSPGALAIPSSSSPQPELLVQCVPSLLASCMERPAQVFRIATAICGMIGGSTSVSNHMRAVLTEFITSHLPISQPCVSYTEADTVKDENITCESKLPGSNRDLPVLLCVEPHANIPPNYEIVLRNCKVGFSELGGD